ncbi:unnamed protein product [Caenorhabditis sp. 36 PRJEB53466]|nr:unnamed protein product [Caenorhabditis sp. 36 PRJEB53466]
MSSESNHAELPPPLPGPVFDALQEQCVIRLNQIQKISFAYRNLNRLPSHYKQIVKDAFEADDPLQLWNLENGLFLESEEIDILERESSSISSGQEQESFETPPPDGHFYGQNSILDPSYRGVPQQEPPQPMLNPSMFTQGLGMAPNGNPSSQQSSNLVPSMAGLPLHPNGSSMLSMYPPGVPINLPGLPSIGPQLMSNHRQSNPMAYSALIASLQPQGVVPVAHAPFHQGFHPIRQQGAHNQSVYEPSTTTDQSMCQPSMASQSMCFPPTGNQSMIMQSLGNQSMIAPPTANQSMAVPPSMPYLPHMFLSGMRAAVPLGYPLQRNMVTPMQMFRPAVMPMEQSRGGPAHQRGVVYVPLLPPTVIRRKVNTNSTGSGCRSSSIGEAHSKTSTCPAGDWPSDSTSKEGRSDHRMQVTSTIRVDSAAASDGPADSASTPIQPNEDQHQNSSHSVDEDEVESARSEADDVLMEEQRCDHEALNEQWPQEPCNGTNALRCMEEKWDSKDQRCIKEDVIEGDEYLELCQVTVKFEKEVEANAKRHVQGDSEDFYREYADDAAEQYQEGDVQENSRMLIQENSEKFPQDYTERYEQIFEGNGSDYNEEDSERVLESVLASFSADGDDECSGEGSDGCVVNDSDEKICDELSDDLRMISLKVDGEVRRSRSSSNSSVEVSEPELESDAEPEQESEPERQQNSVLELQPQPQQKQSAVRKQKLSKREKRLLEKENAKKLETDDFILEQALLENKRLTECQETEEIVRYMNEAAEKRKIGHVAEMKQMLISRRSFRLNREQEVSGSQLDVRRVSVSGMTDEQLLETVKCGEWTHLTAPVFVRTNENAYGDHVAVHVSTTTPQLDRISFHKRFIWELVAERALFVQRFGRELSQNEHNTELNTARTEYLRTIADYKKTAGFSDDDVYMAVAFVKKRLETHEKEKQIRTRYLIYHTLSEYLPVVFISDLCCLNSLLLTDNNRFIHFEEVFLSFL